MPIPEFMPQHAKRIWLNRFCAHLEMLQPSMNCLTAVKHALAVFPDAAHLEPEEAAEVFAAEPIPAGLGVVRATARMQALREAERLQI
jgi:hypothetical protein